MFLKILKMILYFFVIFAKPVYADNFDSTIDTSSNQYFQTIALGTNGYPDIQNIQYEKSDFLADNTSSILSSSLDSFTDFDNTRRIPMVADHIDAPPGTQVDVVYLYRNATGHDVNITKLDWVLSRNIKENGSLTEILDIPEYIEGDIKFKYSSQNLIKSGLFREYIGDQLVTNGESRAFILESFEVKNPLHIDNALAVPNKGGGVDFQIYIQNTSNEYLNNLKFTYGNYEEVFNLSAMQEKVVNFSIDGTPEELGTFSIFNPNIKQICAVHGSLYYTYNQTNAIPVLAYRDGNPIPGAFVQPERESFCVKRIPYTMTSEPMTFTETKNMESTEIAVANEEEVGDILGTSDVVLPKTGKGVWGLASLLVVDVLLWYSWYILRRNYESKNTNSRIRTKSK